MPPLEIDDDDDDTPLAEHQDQNGEYDRSKPIEMTI